MTDLSGRKFGKYELIEQLGRGGMAEVYKAYQPGMNRFVAVKVLHGHLAGSEDFVERFKREAQSVGQLRHPNILQVFDFDVEQNIYYMVMEYIEGDTLKAYIRQRGALPLGEALRLAEFLADALDYAHKKQMVHRDIKPANVMFTDKDHKNPVLTDFGIARLLGDAGLTVSGAFVGTPAYMSPEAGRGEKVDERADIYSLGIMLYEMLTGKVPFDADTPFAVVMKHVNEPLPSMRGVIKNLPPEVELVLLKALAKDPQERFQTSADFKSALQRAREHLGQLADGDSTSAGDMAGLGEKQTLIDESPTPTSSQSERITTPMIDEKQKSPPWALIGAGVGVVGLILALVFVLLTGGDDKQDSSTDNATSIAAVSEGTETPSLSSTPDDTLPETLTPSTDSTDATTEPPTLVADEALQALLAEARGYLENGDLDQAIGTLILTLERYPTNAQAYALLGRTYLVAGQLESAMTYLDDAISRDGSISQAYMDRGAVHLQLRQWEGAIADFTTILDSPPTEAVQVEALTQRGFAYTQAGNRAAAITDLNTALALAPNNAGALLNRARLSLADGEIEAAFNDLNRAIENGGVSAEAYFTRGLAFEISGDSASAINDYSTAIEHDPTLVSAYFQRGLLYAAQADHALALDDFTTVITLDPERREVYPLRAAIYVAQADWPKAVDDYSIALQYDPDNLDYRNQRGLARLQAENYDQALRDFNRVLEVDPNNVDALTMRGLAYVLLGDLDTALADVNRAIELAPEGAWAYQTRASIAMSREAYDDAEADAQRALELEPDRVDAWIVLGQVARIRGNFEDAVTYFSRYLDTGGTATDVRGQRGEVYVALKRYEEALEDLNQALEVNPDAVSFYGNRGVAYVELSQWAEALPDLTIALNNEPTSTHWLAYRSRAYIWLERWDEALADLTTWLEVEPDNAHALQGRAETYYNLGELDPALVDARRAVSLDDSLWFAYQLQAWVLRDRQDYEGALAAINEAILRNPDNTSAYENRGQIYALQGNTDAAIIDLQTAIERGNASPHAYIGLADIYRTTENDEQAIGVLEQAIQAGYADAAIYLSLGDIYNLQGRTEAALEAYRSYVALAGTDAAADIVALVGGGLPTEPVTVNVNTRFVPYLLTDDPAVLAAANEVDRVATTNSPEVALDMINRYFTDFPNDPILLSLRSDIYRDLGRAEEGLLDAQAAIASNPEHPVGYLALARHYFFVEYDGEKAFEYVQQAYDLTPNQPEVLLHYAVGLEWNNHVQESIEYYNRAEAAGAPLRHILWERGEALMRLHQYGLAAADYVRFLEVVSDYYEARYFAAGAYMLDGNPAAALELMRVGVVNYDEPGFYAHAAYVAYRAGDYGLATEWANTALAFDGNQLAATYTLALVATAQGQYETAFATLMSLQGIDDWRYGYPYLNRYYGHSLPLDIARVYIAQGDAENALLYLNQAVQQNYYDSFAHLERARWYWTQGDQDRALMDYTAAIHNDFYDDRVNAIAIMQEIIDLDYALMIEAANYFTWDYDDDMLIDFADLGLKAYPNDAWLLLYQARVHFLQEDNEAALRELLQLQQLAPDHPAAYVGLTEYYYFQGQANTMLAAAEDANARDADHPEVKLNYIRALQYNDRDDEALPLYKAMTGDGFFLYGFLEQRAEYMRDQGETEQVIQDLTRLMALQPNREALWDLVGAYISTGRPQVAFDTLLLYLDLEPDNHRFWGTAAYVAYVAGNSSQAMEWIEQARQLDAESAYATYVTALLAAQSEDYETALVLLQSLEDVASWTYEYPFLNAYFGHTLSVDIARIYRQMGDTEQALAYYADLPYVAPLYIERGEYYLELGRREDARADFMRADEAARDPDLRAEIRRRIIELGPAPSATPSP